MYCNKCGKQNDNGQLYCDDCLKAMAQANQVEALSEEEVAKARKVGRGKALASTIVSGIAMVAIIVGFLLATFGFTMCLPTEGAEGLNVVGCALFIVGLMLYLAALAGSIVSLIYGIASIKVYKNACSQKQPKPIPTLVLGITGTALGGENVVAGAIMSVYIMIYAIGMLII